MLHGAIYEAVLASDKISTHSHHYPDAFFQDISLNGLLAEAYVSWCGVPVGADRAGHAAYLEKVRHKAYFVYLGRAMQALYNMPEPLSVDNWDAYDRAVRARYRYPDWRASVLRERCRYKTSLLDAYWLPGDDGGDRSLFTPVFRIDPYLLAYDKQRLDHDGNNVWTLHERDFSSADAYLDFFEQTLRGQMQNGRKAIKCACAYDRPLRFGAPDRTAANRVFQKKDYTKADEYAFQDYMVDRVCCVAAELGVPTQWHTGMACLRETGALPLLGLIERHPDTTFVLFHGSYPWVNETAALLHNFQNVYADLCWLPILSPTAAVQALHGWLEVATADKLCWGCDAKIPEESYGACIALADVLSTALQQKLDDGYLRQADIAPLLDNILWKNARRLYRLSI